MLFCLFWEGSITLNRSGEAILHRSSRPAAVRRLADGSRRSDQKRHLATRTVASDAVMTASWLALHTEGLRRELQTDGEQCP
jgi:hypothetical protein